MIYMTIALLYGYHYDRDARQSKELKIDEKGRRNVYLWHRSIVTLKYSLKHHYVCVHHSSCINHKTVIKKITTFDLPVLD